MNFFVLQLHCVLNLIIKIIKFTDAMQVQKKKKLHLSYDILPNLLESIFNG